MKSLKCDLSLVVDPKSPLSLQHQVRQRLIDAMSKGVLRPGRRLPSSRLLARQAGVSRNTITLAFETLLAEGHLTSRPRSGIFVGATVQNQPVSTRRRGMSRSPLEAQSAVARSDADYAPPANWQQYPYPFIDGCIDSGLLPMDAWREALRLAFAKQDMLRWIGGGEPDDARLTEELCAKVLPTWGIEVVPDEVVCTVSAALATHLTLQTLIGRDTPVLCATELDGDILARLRDCGVELRDWPADLPPNAVILVGSLRTPTSLSEETVAKLLADAARHDATIVEFIPNSDIQIPGQMPLLSLRSQARDTRIVSIAGLSSTAAFGSAPGLIIANSSLVGRIRSMRQRLGCEFPLGMQRAWAYFIGLGHYDSARLRVAAVLLERRAALEDALNHYLTGLVSVRVRADSSACWIELVPPLKAGQLAAAAAAVGVLIEPIDSEAGVSRFLMGVGSIPGNRIREGVARLAGVVRSSPQVGIRRLRDESVPMLRGQELRRVLCGSTILCNTVSGVPCTLKLRADGSMLGLARCTPEDRDSGRWWVDGDRFYRKWANWAYGECAGFFTIIDGDQIRWYTAEGVLVGEAVIVLEVRAKKVLERAAHAGTRDLTKCLC